MCTACVLPALRTHRQLHRSDVDAQVTWLVCSRLNDSSLSCEIGRWPLKKWKPASKFVSPPSCRAVYRQAAAEAPAASRGCWHRVCRHRHVLQGCLLCTVRTLALVSFILLLFSLMVYPVLLFVFGLTSIKAASFALCATRHSKCYSTSPSPLHNLLWFKSSKAASFAVRHTPLYCTPCSFTCLLARLLAGWLACLLVCWLACLLACGCQVT